MSWIPSDSLSHKVEVVHLALGTSMLHEQMAQISISTSTATPLHLHQLTPLAAWELLKTSYQKRQNTELSSQIGGLAG